jgi:hypothetical protein
MGVMNHAPTQMYLKVGAQFIAPNDSLRREIAGMDVDALGLEGFYLNRFI